MRAKDFAYRSLANAIVVQAANDYRNALKGKSYCEKYTPEQIITKLEKFFRSDWYKMLTRVDGEYLIQELRNEQLCESN